ncbi:hypothetical protein F4802DRAFT_594853 [Xylaria palmicola]|nr:hypothetical protein F4802DRAFT_594853 [Xylaria palmicola]
MSASSQSNAADTPQPMDIMEFMDFLDYPESYQSPSVSPSATSKMQFTPPTPAIATTTSTMPTNQTLSGPSHQYDQYKQQTPFVPGAVANTLALNSTALPAFNLDYINPGEELYNFNGAPQTSMTTTDMDVSFTSPAESTFLFTPTPINSHATSAGSPAVAARAGTLGGMYPGMHQQRAAMARAQQMQQQQELIQRQNQQRPQPPRQSRSKTASTDPIVDQKISQLLSSMRTKANSSEPDNDSTLLQVPRLKKEEMDMDEDERLLASEEGKKLSSKERRQLRNKVSARAFRSRRKEYITQLEQEISVRVNENSDLRAQNRTLALENQRLNDLARALLSSPSFSSYLDTMSQNPAALSQAQTQVEQSRPEPTQVPKETNSYNSMAYGHHEQIGIAMVPEQTMGMSMLNPNPNSVAFPHVFAVFQTPELPEIDTGALMGKSSPIADDLYALNNEKTVAPSLEPPVQSVTEKAQWPQVNANSTTVKTTSSNLDGDIFDDNDCPAHSICPLELDTDGFSSVDIFGGIESEKAFARYELIDSSEDDEVASRALRRVERLAASLAATISGLERRGIEI